MVDIISHRQLRTIIKKKYSKKKLALDHEARFSTTEDLISNTFTNSFTLSVHSFDIIITTSHHVGISKTELYIGQRRWVVIVDTHSSSSALELDGSFLEFAFY